jgi:hypothetical protein
MCKHMGNAGGFKVAVRRRQSRFLNHERYKTHKELISILELPYFPYIAKQICEKDKNHQNEILTLYYQVKVLKEKIECSPSQGPSIAHNLKRKQDLIYYSLYQANAASILSSSSSSSASNIL